MPRQLLQFAVMLTQDFHASCFIYCATFPCLPLEQGLTLVFPISWLSSPSTWRKAGKAQGSGNLIWDPISIWLLIRGEEESRKPNHILERDCKSRGTVKQVLSLLGDHRHLGCLGTRRLARILLSLFCFPS